MFSILLGLVFEVFSMTISLYSRCFQLFCIHIYHIYWSVDISVFHIDIYHFNSSSYRLLVTHHLILFFILPVSCLSGYIRGHEHLCRADSPSILLCWFGSMGTGVLLNI